MSTLDFLPLAREVVTDAGQRLYVSMWRDDDSVLRGKIVDEHGTDFCSSVSAGSSLSHSMHQSSEMCLVEGTVSFNPQGLYGPELVFDYPPGASPTYKLVMRALASEELRNMGFRHNLVLGKWRNFWDGIAMLKV